MTSDADDNLIGNALALGADDFLRKPIVAAELTGRLHARIREMGARRVNDVLKVGDLTYSLSKYSIEVGQKITHLPKLEAELFNVLVQNRDMILTKDELKRRLWGRVVVSDNTLDKKLSVIRKALADIGSRMQVKSIYGQGVSVSYQKSAVKSDT
jgi:DNA-binding response OmpR family regulator